jgi:Fe2+/Zn2+ uptake regulation proteins
MNRTAQREAILKELRSVKTHPTADELYAMLRTKMPTISLGTVYRNLEQMSQVGVIRKLETAGKQKRFDGDVTEHHHLRCMYCGAVSDVAPGIFAAINNEIHGVMERMECESFYLELSGKCQKCRKLKE